MRKKLLPCIVALWCFSLTAQAQVGTYPENEGFTKTRSNVIEGYKCDHYEKGDVEIRIFRKDNGDYLAFEEDPDGLAKRPIARAPIGEARVTLANGVVVRVVKKTDGEIASQKKWADDKLEEIKNTIKEAGRRHHEESNVEYAMEHLSPYAWRIEFPNGNVLLRDAERAGEKLNLFNEFFKDRDEKYLWPHTGYGVFYGSVYTQDADPLMGLCLAGKPDVKYPYVAEHQGYRVGNKIMSLNTSGEVKAYMQVMADGKAFYINDSDSIVSIEEGEVPGSFFSYLWNITYANGDKMTYAHCGTGTDMLKGTIHRNGGVLKLDQGKGRLTLPDGRFYVGTFKESDTNNFVRSLLCSNELHPLEGVYEYSDGRQEKVTGGLTEAERQKQAAQAQAAQEADLKTAKAKLNSYLTSFRQKYGAANVDALVNDGVVKVGATIAMVQAFVQDTNIDGLWVKTTTYKPLRRVRFTSLTSRQPYLSEVHNLGSGLTVYTLNDVLQGTTVIYVRAGKVVRTAIKR